MPSGDLGLERKPISPPIDEELRAKKSIGMLDAFLLSMGFTTTILQHVITPVAEGGMGAGIASAGAAIASVVVVGVSTIAIAGLISYSVLQLINQGAHEAVLLLEKQEELAEKEAMFFARLFYVRHLLKMAGNNHLPQLRDRFKTRLDLNQQAADSLAVTVETIYREEKGFSHALMQRNTLEESEEKAIQRYFSENKQDYLPKMQESLKHFYKPRPTVMHTGRSGLVGAIAGFISFMSMSSGFIGAYYSVVTLSLSIGAVSLAVPILGWAIFGLSLVFALGIGLIVKRYTEKSMERREIMDTLQERDAKLSEGMGKIHELELMLLNERVERMQQAVPEFKPVVIKQQGLRRSQSWSGRFFDRQPRPFSEQKPAVEREYQQLRMR